MKRSHAGSSRLKTVPSSRLRLHSRLSRSHDNLAACGRQRRAASGAVSFRFSADMAHASVPIRRAHSSQSIASPDVTDGKQQHDRNCISKASKRQLRISVPPNMMAYNAELLASFEKEKKALEGKISELIQLTENRKSELERYRFEVKHLKELGYITKQQLGKMDGENAILRKRLTEVGGTEHFTDAEKLSLLQNLEEQVSFDGELSDHADSVREHTDALASLSDVCVTPDHPSTVSIDNSNWDRLSTKSDIVLSELCVANLQDRLLQMEETHYSTSEELEATLQELADLQTSLNQLSSQNELLADEKAVLLESLCSQTEKLENCRLQIEHMKELLVNESLTSDCSERERLLVRLLRGAAEEKNDLLLRQTGIINTMHALEAQSCQLQDAATLVSVENEALLAEKEALNRQLCDVRMELWRSERDAKKLKSESGCLTQVTQRSNTSEEREDSATIDHGAAQSLEQNPAAHELSEGSEERTAAVDGEGAVPLELGACARVCPAGETTGSEEAADQLIVAQEQVGQLREQLAHVDGEAMARLATAEARCAQLQAAERQMKREKDELEMESESLKEHIDQLQLDCDRFLDEKKLHAATVEALEKESGELRCKLQKVEANVAETTTRYCSEQMEWKQFQADLQTAVVIANEIKTETEEDMEKVALENRVLKEKYTSVEQQLTDMQKSNTQSGGATAAAELSDRQTELVGRRRALANHSLSLFTRSASADNAQSLTVKNLIATIEAQVKTDLSAAPESPGGSSVSSELGASASDGCSAADAAEETAATGGVLLQHTDLLTETTRDRRKLRHMYDVTPLTDDTKATSAGSEEKKSPKQRQSILTKSSLRRSVEGEQKTGKYGLSAVHAVRSDPLANLAKQMGGSKRNALLKWCQIRTTAYAGIDITNFSSSWNDGLAFCALLHTYLPNTIPFKELSSHDQARNFKLAFKAAQSVGITTSLNTNDMMCTERPDWQAVMAYLTSIYKHFEADQQTQSPSG